VATTSVIVHQISELNCLISAKAKVISSISSDIKGMVFGSSDNSQMSFGSKSESVKTIIQTKMRYSNNIIVFKQNIFLQTFFCFLLGKNLSINGSIFCCKNSHAFRKRNEKINIRKNKPKKSLKT